MLEAYNVQRTIDALEARLPEEAAKVRQSLSNLLREQSQNVSALFLLVRCHLLCDEAEKARDTLEFIIKHDPGHVPAKVELAKILLAESDTHAAIELLKDATATDPTIDENWRLLSEYLSGDGQEQAGKDAMAQFEMIKAFNDNLRAAEQAFANADFRTSDKMCRKLLEFVPNEVRTLRLLARIARQFRYYEVSVSILTNCVETRPDDVALGLEYAHSLLTNRKYKEALEQSQRLIELAPENIAIYDIKAEALYNLGQFEEAIAIYRELSEVVEKRDTSLLHLGKVLKTVGKTSEAINCFHQAIDDDPMSGRAYWELANLRTYEFSSDEIASMQQALDANDMQAMNTALVQFALGKALEDAKQFEESFQHYQSANNGYRKINPLRYSGDNTSVKSFFTAEYFSGHNESGSNSEAPIFVVGLPRSGSTLVEQILSSHSQVDGTMEVTEITSIARSLDGPGQQADKKYPQVLAKMSGSQTQALAQRYLDHAQALRQSAPCFVDKSPGNFHHIGLIKTLFPNARIIDIRREPMANGWSLYRYFFADSFLFSYDLETIGKYYTDYVNLMDHWHAVLPDQILTVRYEDLVKDLPATVETMLQYCGLEFEDACIDFHLNKRAVATPSSEQVRQPLYNDALEHWKNYAAFLEPLKLALEKHGLSTGI